MIYYDLHIHSALSPCSDDDMTLNNIINMAYIKELDLISVCDHNTLKQLKYFEKLAKNKIDFLYGVEIQTKENIHILAYFYEDKYLEEVQSYLDEHLIKILNNTNFYGNQLIFDDNDQIVEFEKYLLINSLDVDIYDVIDMVYKYNGKVVLAHINRKYGILSQLGYIPEQLRFDGVEVNDISVKDDLIVKYPILKDKIWLIDSDAHHLWSINEKDNYLTEDEYNLLKGR